MVVTWWIVAFLLSESYYFVRMCTSDSSLQGNAIYNIMPDMVSRLSDPDIGVEEDNFRTIMK